MGETRSAKRHKWRLPCEILFDGGRQRSFVLDLSETGLFVQTGARMKPGARVQVRIALDGAAEPLLLDAFVARAKPVPAQLASVAHGGVGLQLHHPPKAYLDALATLEGGAQLRAGLARDAVTPAPPQAAPLRYRVRVKQTNGPRSRTIEVHAETEIQARAAALRETGAGWEVAGVDCIAR
jgi:Tfp pilus assembly protein PilZ